MLAPPENGKALAGDQGTLENSNSTRRFPPYGRQVAMILRDSRRLATFSGCTSHRATIWLLTGPDAWGIAKARPRHLSLVLPEFDDPAAYSWGFLRGHEPVLIDGHAIDDTVRRRQIAAAMFRDGVKRVLAGRILMERTP
jgi:hypothetical protein